MSINHDADTLTEALNVNEVKMNAFHMAVLKKIVNRIKEITPSRIFDYYTQEAEKVGKEFEIDFTQGERKFMYLMSFRHTWDTLSQVPDEAVVGEAFQEAMEEAYTEAMEEYKETV